MTRESDVGETYKTAPRINSSHLRTTYSRIVHLTDNLNFNSPVFNDMLKRNRSLGSTQAFICEQALANKEFVDEYIKPFCIDNGANLLHVVHYADSVYFDRLALQKANEISRRAKAAAPVLSPTPTRPAAPVRQEKPRSYFLGGK